MTCGSSSEKSQCWNLASSCLDCSTFCRLFWAYYSPLNEGFETQEGILFFFFYWEEVLTYKEPSCVLIVYLFVHLFIHRVRICSASYVKSAPTGAYRTCLTQDTCCHGPLPWTGPRVSGLWVTSDTAVDGLALSILLGETVPVCGCAPALRSPY